MSAGVEPGGAGGAGVDGSYVGEVTRAALKIVEFVGETMCLRTRGGSGGGEGREGPSCVAVQRAVMSRASRTLRAFAALVAQEPNMYPRNRSLRALCLTHADATRILSAMRSLAHAPGARSGGGGLRMDFCAGAVGWEDVVASGGCGWVWRGEEEHRRELLEVCGLLEEVDAALVDFVVSKMLEQAQLFLDMKSSNDWASVPASSSQKTST